MYLGSEIKAEGGSDSVNMRRKFSEDTSKQVDYLIMGRWRQRFEEIARDQEQWKDAIEKPDWGQQKDDNMT